MSEKEIQYLKDFYPNIKSLEDAIKIIADQDMRIGKLTREIDYKSDTIYISGESMRQRKNEAGYYDSVSFDVVWDEVLERAISNEIPWYSKNRNK